MKCPDCSGVMKKHGAFYTCTRCGLSFKPWEVEKANERAQQELKNLELSDPEKAREDKRKKRIKYRNWLEGRQD
ncbi:MAG: hypothetical protein OEY49_01015 [Candidatus Heimdallarchaeota archaeon]|nr:hypothetical protein [Candidatus Heimdallarchaeota archaeon]